MRKIIILIALTFSIITAKAQQQAPVNQYALSQNTKVTTANGQPYAYAEWQKLWATNKYKLKPTNPESDSTAFTLILRDTVAEAAEFAGLSPRQTIFFKRGNHFVLLNMQDVNGKTITAEELRGKIIVFNFWQVASAPSRYQIAELNRVADAYKNDSNIVFVAITTDDKAYVQEFLKISPFNFNVIPAGAAYFTYHGVTECPVTLVIDKDGNIAFQSLGYNNGAVPYWVAQTIKKLKTAK
ncbi:TlpA disulfide reductase family protein [Mucilaginibacter pedocola]|uniref:Thioredoxin domain-containing protein n=1 Tax=Mucilaginibacter pedocola TaxID=1792845 RepID=A0A1S9PD45_9SPHI|nr:TlpA disulfide reductase family protein [Mucilaginibacter pedocola]OOQ58849.1 hypothetical protein BC343_09395 [Mucilaginibacter pedocola]